MKRGAPLEDFVSKAPSTEFPFGHIEVIKPNNPKYAEITAKWAADATKAACLVEEEAK